MFTELRKDPTKGTWVLVQVSGRGPYRERVCPFCPGQEALAPPEILAIRSDGQPANDPEWLVRVVPERAPMFMIEVPLCREGIGVYDKISARGASEIVIETRDHQASLATLPEDQVERVLRAYRERIRDLKKDAELRSILVIKRHGAGSIGHPFSRVLAAPIIFDDIRDELTAARQYFGYKQRCLYCDLVQQEIGVGARVIRTTPAFVALAPYASRVPYEAWIIPLRHQCGFEQISDGELHDLACLLRWTAGRLAGALGDPPYELAIHSAPNEGMKLRPKEWETLTEDYHWHIEILPHPRGATQFGGFAVNPVPPETAARTLAGLAPA